MKRFPWLRLGLPLLLAAVAAGCFSAPDPAGRAEREFFTAAASRLDAEGSFYFIANFGNIRRSFGEWLRRTQVAVAEAEGSAARREKLQLAASGGELMLRLLGVDFLAGVGASSVRILPAGADGEAVFRNRLFFVSRANRKGPLWEAGGASAPRLAWLDALPADTVLALSFVVDPARFLVALEGNREATDSLERFCRIFTGTDAKELLGGFAGEWQLVIGGTPETVADTASEFRAALVIPDRGNRLFDRLKMLGKADENGERIVIPAPADGVTPVLLRRPDLLVFCSSPAAEAVGAFLADRRSVPEGGTPPEAPWKVTLGAQPRFRRFAAGVPAGSHALLFCQMPQDEATSRIRIAGVNMPLDNGRAAMVIAVAQLFEEGWLVTSHSNTDLNEDLFFDSMLLPALAAARLLADRIPGVAAGPRAPAAEVKKEDDASAEQPAEAPADPPAELEKCAAAIATAGKAGAGGDSEEFRRFTPPAAGEGQPETPPEFPVMMDLPGRHRGGFHVFYRSGKVAWIPLERPGSFCRMIGALQSMHHYPEPIFTELIRQAAEFDRAAEPKK